MKKKFVTLALSAGVFAGVWAIGAEEPARAQASREAPSSTAPAPAARSVEAGPMAMSGAAGPAPTEVETVVDGPVPSAAEAAAPDLPALCG